MLLLATIRYVFVVNKQRIYWPNIYYCAPMLALAALPPFSKDDGKKKHYKKFASDKSKVTFTVVLFSSLVQSILFCNSAFSTALL